MCPVANNTTENIQPGYLMTLIYQIPTFVWSSGGRAECGLKPRDDHVGEIRPESCGWNQRSLLAIGNIQTMRRRDYAGNTN